MRKLMIGTFVALAGIALACGAGEADTAGPGAQAGAADSGDKPAENDKRTYVLEVTGPKKADINYSLNADSSSANGAKLPWKKTLTSVEDFTSVSVLASNSGSGTIKCKITLNGKVVKENAAEGQYGTVTCSTDSLTQP